MFRLIPTNCMRFVKDSKKILRLWKQTIWQRTQRLRIGDAQNKFYLRHFVSISKTLHCSLAILTPTIRRSLPWSSHQWFRYLPGSIWPSVISVISVDSISNLATSNRPVIETLNLGITDENLNLKIADENRRWTATICDRLAILKTSERVAIFGRSLLMIPPMENNVFDEHCHWKF